VAQTNTQGGSKFRGQVTCESFTHLSVKLGRVRRPHGEWESSPFHLRGAANEIFAEGVNRIQMHSFSYSPPEIPYPGWRMYAELQLNRNSPWWHHINPLTTWLARNHWLLQAGRPVADALVYPVASDPPDGPFREQGSQQPVSARDAVDGANRFTLPFIPAAQAAGAYEAKTIILTAPPASTEEVEHLLSLVEGGATLHSTSSLPEAWAVNSRPLPSETIRRLAAMTSAGRIRDARSEGWASALAASRTVRWTPAAAELSFQRRRVDGRDLYFVVNLGDDFEGEVSFPQTGGLWEVWDADHGSIRPAAQLSARGGRTHLRLSLRHAESTWISSSSGDQGPPVQVVRASGGSFHYSETGLLLGCFDRAGQHEVTLSNGESRSIDVSIPAPVLLDGPWSLSVRSEQALSPQRPVTLRLERLVSWRQIAELRRYAGSATYTTEFDLPEKMCRPDVAVVLDLGEVYELANVEVNGHAVGTVWCGPFSIEVTDAVRPGRNQLRLEVPNQMKNSLERSDGFARALGGDGKRSPEPDATADFYMRPSGLLGPVVLRATGRVVIAPANLLERN